MFRGDGSFVLFSICLLLYFDSSVDSARLSKFEDSKNRLQQNEIKDEKTEKYRSRSVHEKRIENLIGASEKSLRSSSPLRKSEKSLPTRRQNSKRLGKKKKSGKFKNQSQALKPNERKLKDSQHFQTRLARIKEKMKKDKLKRFYIEPAFGCSTKYGSSPRGCPGSKSRQKRITQESYDQVHQWVNETCTTCWNQLPWGIMDMELGNLPAIPLPTLPFPTIQLPSLSNFAWPFSWPGSWFGR